MQPCGCGSLTVVDDVTITRDIDLELSGDELWDLVGAGDAWSAWLADEADVDVAPGSGGHIVDDGEHRHVRVDVVEPGVRVTYRWWSDDLPDAISTVDLLVVPRVTGSTLRIRETLSVATASAATVAASRRWEVRAVVLWARTREHVLG